MTPSTTARLRLTTLVLGAPALIALGVSEGANAPANAPSPVLDTVTVNSAKAVWPDTATLIPESTVGKKDGSQDFKFLRITAIAVGPKGELFVADAGTRSIREFVKGAFVRRIGGAAGAPGGFETVVGLSAAPDGRLFLREQEGNGINVYAADGKPLGHWPVPPGQVAGRGRAPVLRADEASGAMAATWLGAPTDPRLSGNAVVRLTAVGKVRDTLKLSSRYVGDCPVVYIDAPIRMLLGPAPQVHWTLGSRGEIIAGCSKRYSFDVINPSGQVIRVSRAWTPIPISKQERDERVAAWERQMQAQLPRWKWTKPPHPTQQPAYAAFFAADDGRIWVVTAMPSELVKNPATGGSAGPDQVWRERHVLDVFDGRGTYQGLVRIPVGMRLNLEPVIRGDTVWAATIDAEGTHAVTRFRLQHGKRSK